MNDIHRETEPSDPSTLVLMAKLEERLEAVTDRLEGVTSDLNQLRDQLFKVPQEVMGHIRRLDTAVTELATQRSEDLRRLVLVENAVEAIERHEQTRDGQAKGERLGRVLGRKDVLFVLAVASLAAGGAGSQISQLRALLGLVN